MRAANLRLGTSFGGYLPDRSIRTTPIRISHCLEHATAAVCDRRRKIEAMGRTSCRWTDGIPSAIRLPRAVNRGWSFCSRVIWSTTPGDDAAPACRGRPWQRSSCWGTPSRRATPVWSRLPIGGAQDRRTGGCRVSGQACPVHLILTVRSYLVLAG